MLNIVLVTVLVEYNRASQIQSDIAIAARRVFMLRAFRLLDVYSEGIVSVHNIRLVLDELFTCYHEFRRSGVSTAADKELLIRLLDMDLKGVIAIEDFLLMIDVVSIELRTDETFVQRYCPWLAFSRPFLWLTGMVSTIHFDLGVDLIEAVLIMTWLLVSPNPVERSTLINHLAFLILIVFVAEIGVKLATLGYRSYVVRTRNRVDATLTGLYVLATVMGYLGKTQDTVLVTAYYMERVIGILRIVALPRNIGYLYPDSVITRCVSVVRRILRRIYALGVVFLCIGFSFASLGVYLFGGSINFSENNPSSAALAASPYGHFDYYSLNFNDMFSAGVSLFCCLHTSGFDVVASGFVAVTDIHARWFFAAWYVVGTLLLFNIIVAYFLSEFSTTAVFSVFTPPLPPSPSPSPSPSLPVSTSAGTESDSLLKMNNSTTAASTTAQKDAQPTPTTAAAKTTTTTAMAVDHTYATAQSFTIYSRDIFPITENDSSDIDDAEEGEEEEEEEEKEGGCRDVESGFAGRSGGLCGCGRSSGSEVDDEKDSAKEKRAVDNEEREEREERGEGSNTLPRLNSHTVFFGLARTDSIFGAASSSSSSFPRAAYTSFPTVTSASSSGSVSGRIDWRGIRAGLGLGGGRGGEGEREGGGGQVEEDVKTSLLSSTHINTHNNTLTYAPSLCRKKASNNIRFIATAEFDKVSESVLVSVREGWRGELEIYLF